jgi:hypothetical protein
MKTVVLAVMISLGVVACGVPALPAAESKSAMKQAAAPAAALAGQYKGAWKSADATTGDLRLAFKSNGDAAWAADASFTYEGTTFPTRMKTVRIEGAKIELVFEWDVDGNPAQSKVHGELKGDTLQGSYVTSGAAGETRGTWSVTRL